ncbi:MAG TPA: NHL repeat-containing protein [Solirubrobacteraceae bacterium]|nr:NHL repeat-containing protein [Solirubrobacteraceae bacterium]
MRALALVALLLGVLMLSSSAQAALVHPFLGTISKSKKGFGEEICGVSVDRATGELFVSEPEAEDIQVFDKNGTFLSGRTISAVLVPEEETAQEKAEREAKEKAEIEKGKTPKEPAGKFEKEELEEFCSTAVNDKNGFLYVADGGTEAIYPFDKESHQVFKTNKEGKRIPGAEITGKETPAGEFGEELSIAIDQNTGRMYVADREHEVVDYFSEAGKYEGQLAFPGASGEHLPGALAVDPKTGEVYVSVQGQAFDEEEDEGFAFVYVFSASGEFLREISGQRSGAFAGFGAERAGEAVLTGLAVGPEGNLYASDGARRVVFEFDGTNFIGQIGGTSTGLFSEPADVDLNQAGDVYVVDRTEARNAERHRAEVGLESLPGQLDEFGPAQVTGEPTIEAEGVSAVTSSSATLDARIDPTGVATSYYFELCQGGSCSNVPAPPGVGIGSGEVSQVVSQPVTGLSANTVYSYRAIATYGGGASMVVGAVQTFTTRTEGGSVQLPDGRGWELVSSPEKHGAGLEAIPREGGLIQAAEDGSGLTYIGLAPDEAEPEGSRVPTFTQLLSKRGGEGPSAQWVSDDITIPGENATGAVTGNGKQEYRAFSLDLGLSLVEPLGLSPQAEPHLSPEDSERTIYTRKTEGCEAPPSSCYTPLVTAANDTAGTKFGGAEGKKRGIEFKNATPDISHVVLTSLVQLTTDPVNTKHSNLYEWWAGQLHLVNVLPEGVAEEGLPELGGNHVTRHALSDDGSRVIFTFGKHLFVRDMVAGVTTQVDPQPVLGEEAQAVYQTASSDGTKIFFTDEAKLTAKSSAARGSSDLYEYDLNSHTLSDLSPDPSYKQNGEFAAVRGLVPGVSEDGSTVYFVANGVLTSAPNANGEVAQPGHCRTVLAEREEETPAGATCNLYVKHGAEETSPPTFIGRLSTDDLPDWENTNGNLENVTDRVSPGGGYFAFMSNRSLTGYDNRDVNPAAHEARDEEVFLYDDTTGELTCASCDASGARPAGVFDGGSAVRGEEGLGLLVDRVEAWEGRWLAGSLPGWTGSEGQTATYQSRYLSDSGRLFFNTTEALAQGDTNGNFDVYEYEPPNVGGCTTEGGCTGLISSGSSTHASAFLDASASGDDVFFLTAAALVSSDHDAGFDVYDAHVCGTGGCVVTPETKNTSCNSIEECRPATPSIPSFGAPAGTVTPSGGNVSGQIQVLPHKEEQAPKSTTKKPTKKQLLAKALKSCHKLKKKSKRKACERKARKRYGPSKAKKGGAKGGRR